jgi:hypothetical protein
VKDVQIVEIELECIVINLQNINVMNVKIIDVLGVYIQKKYVIIVKESHNT